MREKSIDTKRDYLEEIRTIKDYWDRFLVRIILMEAFDKCSYFGIQFRTH